MAAWLKNDSRVASHRQRTPREVRGVLERTMDTVSRWLAPAFLAVGAGLAAMTPAPVQARDDDELVRIIVDVADVVLRGGVPYYRYGDYRHDDRLIVGRDRYGRPVYYRHAPRRDYGRAYKDYRVRDDYRAGDVRCNRSGWCTVTYYDPRYDRRYDNRYHRFGDRRW